MMECFAQRYCELNPGVFTSTGWFYVGIQRVKIIVYMIITRYHPIRGKMICPLLIAV